MFETLQFLFPNNELGKKKTFLGFNQGYRKYNLMTTSKILPLKEVVKGITRIGEINLFLLKKSHSKVPHLHWNYPHTSFILYTARILLTLFCNTIGSQLLFLLERISYANTSLEVKLDDRYVAHYTVPRKEIW